MAQLTPSMLHSSSANKSPVRRFDWVNVGLGILAIILVIALFVALNLLQPAAGNAPTNPAPQQQSPTQGFSKGDY